MKYPARIKKELPQYLRRERGGDCPEHRKWIRQQKCLLDGPFCGGSMHAHHVRTASNSGTGMKPDDEWCVPLCSTHHDRHHKGIKDWEWKGVNMQAAAKDFAARSPALRRLGSRRA